MITREDVLAAFRAAFGSDLAEFDRQFLTYLRDLR